MDDERAEFETCDLGRFKPSGFAHFPEAVQDHIGYTLYVAQTGGRHRDTKPMTGLGGGHVIEVIKDHRGDTFRAVYTVHFAHAVYVLHAFQKKSKSGIATPRRELELIKKRLREAEEIAKRRGHEQKDL